MTAGKPSFLILMRFRGLDAADAFSRFHEVLLASVGN